MPLFDFLKPNVESMRKKGDVQALVNVLSTDKHDAHLRLAAANALGELKNPSSYEALKRVALQRNVSQELAMAAIKALEALGDDRFIDILIDWLRSSSEKFQRDYARRVLVQNPEKSVQPLIAVMTGNNMGFCLTAAEVLTEIGTPEALESVEKDRVHLEEERRQRDKRMASFRNVMVEVLEARREELMESGASENTCKAFRDGRCVVRGVDSGACTWKPSDWQNCNVVTENKKFYGAW